MLKLQKVKLHIEQSILIMTFAAVPISGILFLTLVILAAQDRVNEIIMTTWCFLMFVVLIYWTYKLQNHLFRKIDDIRKQLKEEKSNVEIG